MVASVGAHLRAGLRLREPAQPACDQRTQRQPGGGTAYQVLAGLIGTAPRSAEELYRGAPYGVGYFVGVWQP